MDNFDHTYSDNSDHEINESQHSNLLAAVSELDIKQRVKPPTRKESSFQVSEFHLGKSNARKNEVFIRNLAKSLGQRGSHAPITKQLRFIDRKSRTLPRPLEKPVAARIQRSVGFQNVKDQLGRWDAVVHSNRAADQLTFPLKQSTVTFHTTDDFISKLKLQSRTPLEQQMDEILNSSPAVQEDRKEEEEYQLNLAEMRERRKEMAKLRAQQSYMAAKASRQKKIKSKKYHRVQRRERTQQQLKDFEALQKTDPEAALQQLEQLERTRAEERMSLRHRSTGQWARNKAVRAKYDKESRQELAQQLAVSRDLTQKVQTENSSDEEGEEEDSAQAIPTNSDNPWITPKLSTEVEEFVSGYRKFWEERNKKSSEESGTANNIADGQKDVVDTKGVRDNNNEGVEIITLEKGKKNSPNKENRSEQTNNSTDTLPKGKQLLPNQRISQSKQNSITEEVNSSTRTHAKSKKLSLNKKKSITEQINVSTDKQPKNKKLSPNKQNGAAEEVNSSNKIQLKRKGLSPAKQNNTQEQLNKKKRTGYCFNSEMYASNPLKSHSTVIATTNSWVVTPVETEVGEINEFNESGGNKNKRKSTSKNKMKIGKLFDDMEEKLKEKVGKKIQKLKSKLNIKDKNKAEGASCLESDTEGPSLKLKRVNARADLDEELVEQPHDRPQENESSDMTLEKILAVSRIQEEERTPPVDNIDPNKFIAMKAKHLLTELPDVVTAGDEAIDDNEGESEERQMTITEAFAEDDIVAEFRKEKEDVTEKSQPQNVDMSLPGWGEWGGKDLPVSSRKKRRFIVKFPVVPPRKDANKGSVIINEEKNDKVVSHQVSELPFPFKSVKDFEASIRAPIGNTWIPETAHRKLTKPSVVTKLGTIIEPMDEDMLVKKSKIVK